VVVLLLMCCLCLIVGVGGYVYIQNNDAGISEIFDTLVQPSQPGEVKSGEEKRFEVGGFVFITIPNYDVDNSSMDLGMVRMNPSGSIGMTIAIF
jgi:hypothetical protein